MRAIALTALILVLAACGSEDAPNAPIDPVPESCARHTPLYDASEDDVWTADGVAEISECDEGCASGAHPIWYFVAPEDGAYVFEAARRDDGMHPEAVAVGIHADAECGPAPDYLDALPSRVSMEMRAGEVVGLAVVSTIYVGFYSDLESTQMPFELSATRQP